MFPGYKNVCCEVVAHNLCAGCGLCAGVCPQKTLKMRFNKFGEYSVFDANRNCSVNCELCLEVCPFSNQVENEDSLAEKEFADIPGIKHRSESGYYLSALVGYSNLNSHRVNGASGGLTTWTLETLLKQEMADFVACVSPAKDSDKLFKFVISSTPEDVRACSKSCYYPVETSEIIHHILTHDGRYAVIGLPCFVKAFRLAMQVRKKLRQRVRFLLGLVCGQGKSKFFAEYICSLGGGDPRYLEEITFRIKDNKRSASDYGLRFVCESTNHTNGHEGTVFWTEGMDRAWCDRYFTLNACDYCDDLFAELADVSFMDAWLPKYTRDSAGTNLVIIRNPTFKELFQKGSDTGEIKVDTIDIESVIYSQRGALLSKRNGLAKRLTFAKKLKRQVPKKRVLPLNKISFRELLKTWLQTKTTQKSKTAFLKQKVFGPGLEIFQKKMRPYDCMDRLLSRSKRHLRKAKRIFHR